MPEDTVDDPAPEPEGNNSETLDTPPETSTPTYKRKQDASQSEVKNKRHRQDKELASFLKKREEERTKYTEYLDKLTQPEEDDEIDLFFKSMAATVKKFSPGLKTQTKLEVMQTVCKYERQNMTSAGTSGSGSNSFSTFNYNDNDYDSFGSFGDYQ